jgi:CRP/FNR family cyclic AMP-dependent transcriptional regulator
MDAKRIKAGEFIFKEGERPQAIYLIRAGTVSIQREYQSAGGKETVELARVTENELMGEMAFFDRQERSASAVAVTDVDVLELDFESLDKVYLAVPDYMKMVMATIVARFRKANDRIRELQEKADPRFSSTRADAEAYGALSLIQGVGGKKEGKSS